MQKLLGKARFEELLAAYIEKPQGKPTLVPESDKRPAMNTAKVAKIEAAIEAAYREGESKLKGNGKSVPALSVLKTPLRDGEPLGGKASAESDFAIDDDDDFLN